MTYRLSARGLLRAVRSGIARLNDLLTETGSSDDDLVFHIRNSDGDRPLSDRESRDLILSRHGEAPERPRSERPGRRTGSPAAAIQDSLATSCPRIRAGTGPGAAAPGQPCRQNRQGLRARREHDIEAVATLLEQPLLHRVGDRRRRADEGKTAVASGDSTSRTNASSAKLSQRPVTTS